ncbi:MULTISPECIES: DUF4097 family beta strand repeat-containing protein [Streptomyces]|uniref:Lipoprotein n=1 Tax=Streptomyces sviceus (strain ATCC 29083 / DSM 924 / JCM 4929 / NBRC 13980 / NCIMB 11184 / NRRL 5439 / UC 5370) TaxID=463191 RepID=B5I2P2_STRX2|nr:MULTISPECIES: DUF4097 family beta strand repeat-containing protein [Streptomyces]EDY59347.1 lipoprotein [Streptomyces sviceus ATCC 29083]MYT05514.1 DUF4097 family beta strand repeat protein [Streptomyces sp. SID5470]
MVRSVPARAAAAAGVLALVVAGATACGASAGDDKTPDHKAFALQGRTLTVDSDDSALEIVAADSNKAGTIEVTRWFQGTVAVGKDPEVTWSMKDDRLVLRMKCSGVVADCAAKHRIEVPRDISVKVEDGDGSVRARGFTRPLSISTGDGSVRVTDSSGPLELRTGDGSMRAQVTSRRVTARTGDGSLHLELGAVPERVETRSGDGSVTVELPKATYRVDTKSGDGGVDVSVPRSDSSDHFVSAQSGDGKITVRTAN